MTRQAHTDGVHRPAPQRGPGRPTDNPREGHIHLRVPMEVKNRYVRTAQKQKKTLSQWIIDTCDKAS